MMLLLHGPDDCALWDPRDDEADELLEITRACSNASGERYTLHSRVSQIPWLNSNTT